MRSHIQSQLSDSGIAKTATQTADNLNKKVKRSFFKSKRRIIRNGLLSANVLLVIGVAAFIINARNSHSSRQAPVLNLVSESTITDPLDTLSGVDIASNVAKMSGINEASTLAHNVDAETAKDGIVPSGSQAVSKPQILKTELKSKSDIEEYRVAEGDTIESIAIAFGVSSRSISWSNNNLSNATLSVGSLIYIPPVDGIVYKVRSGDTPSTLASAYSTSEARIVAFNDAELGGLATGDLIVIPDGQIAQTSASRSSGYVYNFTAAYGGNGYSPGNCTWHTANRRAAVGKPLPSNLGNAATWVARAAAAGIPTGTVPQQYAAVATSRVGWGHVGFVEEVYPDGSFLMSEMNYNWNLYALRYRVVPADEAARYGYIY